MILEKLLDLPNVRSAVPGLKGMCMKFGRGDVSEARILTPEIVGSQIGVLPVWPVRRADLGRIDIEAHELGRIDVLSVRFFKLVQGMTCFECSLMI